MILILTLGTMAKVAAPAAILVHQVYVTLEFLMTTLLFSAQLFTFIRARTKILVWFVR